MRCRLIRHRKAAVERCVRCGPCQHAGRGNMRAVVACGPCHWAAAQIFFLPSLEGPCSGFKCVVTTFLSVGATAVESTTSLSGGLWSFAGPLPGAGRIGLSQRSRATEGSPQGSEAASIPLLVKGQCVSPVSRHACAVCFSLTFRQRHDPL
ncbi:hypothetical protein NDU88_003154 [Pleurodeles waltl]|uniref:Uncharacterized protein n=1 Tax=Pleurodeles waltl TaxID=8319 RepID=A0AAV7UBL8_PLEWA|nr:hypothetical protein NDU88_003154 [Pleurodeles waltl]